MRSITLIEIEKLVEELTPNVSFAQLQEVRVNARYLALGFFNRDLFWIVVDLHPAQPLVMFFANECPVPKGFQSKPLGLFIQAHLKNRFFDHFEIKKQLGRVLRIHFRGSTKDSEQESCYLELQLIPKRVNCLVVSGSKQLSWEKPQVLTEVAVSESVDLVKAVEIPRNNELLIAEWKSQQKTALDGQGGQPSLDPQVAWEKQRQKDLQKKRKALDDIEKSLLENKEVYWYEMGEALKTQGSLEVEDRFQKNIDRTKGFSQNLENAFFKARQIKAKKQGTLERCQILKTEILKLEQAQYRLVINKTQRRTKDLLETAGAQGRTKSFVSGIRAYLGKSAQDNLRILRRARAWDLWLHLRDFPGAHAIIHREKNQNVTDLELQEVSRWLVKESLASKSLQKGQKFSVVVVESRFVRPIKGDKLGRVNYHSEKVLTIEY